MLDKSIPYHNIYMKRKKGKKIPEIILPKGFTFVSYKKGDEQEWAEIEASVGEFDTKEDALKYFKKVFLPLEEVKRERYL